MPKKPVTDPHKAWNIAHHKRLEAYNKRIEALLNRAITQAADLAMRHGAKATADTPFSYSQDRQLKAETEQLLKDLSDEITKVTKQAETKEWEQAYKQSIDYLSSVYNVAKQTEAMQALFDERLVGMKARNLDAFRAFQERKIGGLRLSDKVWDYTKDFERQMEASIDMALLEGKSAEALSRDIRSLLTDPDALFRRVRDKDTGELRMSRAMAAFHPGTGKYRSAYKNAMRLARSEINMAYRSSDSQTAQEFDACVGIRVNLSNNHTCNGKPFVDICDELEGNYPKSFIFRGWHPVCRCFITYILKTDEEFWRDLENGENNESVNTVHDVPDQFKEWVGKNEERIAKAEERGTLPYFLRDNESFWESRVDDFKAEFLQLSIEEYNKQHYTENFNITDDMSYYDTMKWLNEDSRKAWLSASDDERKSLVNYTSNYSMLILIDCTSGKPNKHVENIKKILDQVSISKDLVVTSYQREDVIKAIFGDEFVNTYKSGIDLLNRMSGKTGVNRAFMSTSYTSRYDRAKPYKLQIFCPKGTSAMNLSEISRFQGDKGIHWDGVSTSGYTVAENEVLLNCNYRYQFLRAEEANGETTLYIQLLDRV